MRSAVKLSNVTRRFVRSVAYSKCGKAGEPVTLSLQAFEVLVLEATP